MRVIGTLSVRPRLRPRGRTRTFVPTMEVVFRPPEENVEWQKIQNEVRERRQEEMLLGVPVLKPISEQAPSVHPPRRPR